MFKTEFSIKTFLQHFSLSPRGGGGRISYEASKIAIFSCFKMLKIDLQCSTMGVNTDSIKNKISNIKFSTKSQWTRLFIFHRTDTKELQRWVMWQSSRTLNLFFNDRGGGENFCPRGHLALSRPGSTHSRKCGIIRMKENWVQRWSRSFLFWKAKAAIEGSIFKVSCMQKIWTSFYEYV